MLDTIAMSWGLSLLHAGMCAVAGMVFLSSGHSQFANSFMMKCAKCSFLYFGIDSLVFALPGRHWDLLMHHGACLAIIAHILGNANRLAFMKYVGLLNLVEISCIPRNIFWFKPCAFTRTLTLFVYPILRFPIFTFILYSLTMRDWKILTASAGTKWAPLMFSLATFGFLAGSVNWFSKFAQSPCVENL